MKLVAEMFDTLFGAVENLRDQISEVRYGNEEGVILFNLRGVPYRGTLSGRNQNLLLGFGEAQDRGVAVRVLLDGSAYVLSFRGTPQ